MMERRSWAIQIGGSHHIVDMEHRHPDRGEVRVDGRLTERWERTACEEADRIFFIKGRRCALHLRYDGKGGRCTYDLSLDGVSVVTGGDVSADRSAPSEGIVKSWALRLEGGIHTLEFTHSLYDRRVIRLDGHVVEESRFYEERPGDHLVLYKGHRIGIHLRRWHRDAFIYDATVDGTSLETGRPVPFFDPSPAELRKKTWVLTVQGVPCRIELQHLGRSRKNSLTVDGKTALKTGFPPDGGEGFHSFSLRGLQAALSIRNVSGLRYAYRLVVGGEALESGERIFSGDRRWIRSADGGNDEVLLDPPRLRERIGSDGNPRETSLMERWKGAVDGWTDRLGSPPLGSHLTLLLGVAASPLWEREGADWWLFLLFLGSTFVAAGWRLFTWCA